MDIKEVVRLHGLWLAGDPAGVLADLSDANLRGANLSCANLRGANLRGADLSDAYLRGANLSGAYLSGANLSGANLSGAYLSGANLSGANLSGANLSGAYLSGAYLSGANLSGADLSDANLRGAYLPATVNGCVSRLDFGVWSICVYHDRTQIGCELHGNDKWLSWSPESPEIAAMDSRASEWWQTHGDAVKAVIRCVMAKAAKYAEVKSDELV